MKYIQKLKVVFCRYIGIFVYRLRYVHYSKNASTWRKVASFGRCGYAAQKTVCLPQRFITPAFFCYGARNSDRWRRRARTSDACPHFKANYALSSLSTKEVPKLSHRKDDRAGLTRAHLKAQNRWLRNHTVLRSYIKFSWSKSFGVKIQMLEILWDLKPLKYKESLPEDRYLYMEVDCMLAPLKRYEKRSMKKSCGPSPPLVQRVPGSLFLFARFSCPLKAECSPHFSGVFSNWKHCGTLCAHLRSDFSHPPAAIWHRFLSLE